MQKIIYLLICVGLLITSFSFGKIVGEKDDQQNIALLVRKPNHLKVSLLTLYEMKKDQTGGGYKSASIIVCGKDGVESLKKGGVFSKDLLEIKDKEISVKACGVTMKKFDIRKNELDEKVEIVKNGLLEMIRLKRAGYLGIDL
ncbi:MAG: hypothetical protein KC478_12325 [Bacteriovoracaceae bacterium]|nr:hypothetical protein [Bacteriovoracaceae bacterium]